MEDEPTQTAETSGSAAMQSAPQPLPSRPVETSLVLWMVALTLLWGLNAISIKALTESVAPFMAAGLRGVIALLLLTGYGWVKKERMLYAGSDLFHGLAIGGMFAAEFALIYFAAPLTNGGHIAIFINTAPFFVALGAHFLLRGEALHPLKLVGLGVAFLGVVLLFSDELYIQQGGFWKGDLMILIGAFMWASATIYMKRFMIERFNAFSLLYVQVAVSTPILLILSLLTENQPIGAVDAAALGNLIFQSVVVVFLSYLMWFHLLRIYQASAMQSLTFLSPVWGVAAGIVLLDEKVTVLLIGGMVMVGVGLVLANRPRGGRGGIKKRPDLDRPALSINKIIG